MQSTSLQAKLAEMAAKSNTEIFKMIFGKSICHQVKANGLSWLNLVAFQEESTLVVS